MGVSQREIIREEAQRRSRRFNYMTKLFLSVLCVYKSLKMIT